MAKQPDIVREETRGRGTKRLPIVLCLDLSPSMFNYDRYIYQNDAVRMFLRAICRNRRILETAEIAFITFADKILLETDFMPIWNLSFPAEVGVTGFDVSYRMLNSERKYRINTPAFYPLERDACTELPMAVSRAHEKIKERLRELPVMGLSHYAPFLLVTTDGNPDMKDYAKAEELEYSDEEKRVIRELGKSCNPACPVDDLILPFFVGIGDEDVDLSHLRRLAENLPSGLCPLEKRDKDLEKLGNMFSALADTISQSVNYNSSTAGLLERVAESIGKLTQKN